MNVPAQLPIFPLGNVLYPGSQMPLHIFEERYRQLMRDRLHDDPIFGVVLTETGLEVGDEPTIHLVGTAAKLLAASELPDGRWAIVVEGTRRFRVLTSSWERSYLVGSIEWIDDPDPLSTSSAAIGQLIVAFVGYLRAVGAELVEATTIEGIEDGLREAFSSDLDGLIYLIAAQLPLNTWHRQRILEIPSAAERARAVRSLLRQEQVILERAGATTWLTTHPTGSILPN